MFINDEYAQIVEKRYKELTEKNLVEGFLDEANLGEIKLFTKDKPKMTLGTFTIGSETVYVGSND